MERSVEHRRMVEALLFAAVEPLDENSIASRLPEGAQVTDLLAELKEQYSETGINLTQVAGKWAFRTAPDLAFLLQKEVTTPRRLSRAAVETLAIVAYHQPVTRSEIEEIRGVGLSKGTLDLLMEIGWVLPKGRRRTPGKPMTYATSEQFLDHFGLEGLDQLPGFDELKAAGFLEIDPPDSLAAAQASLPLADSIPNTDSHDAEDNEAATAHSE